MNGKEGIPNYTSLQDCLVKTFKQSGIRGFYKGFSAALLRQGTYSPVRIYVYEKIKKYVG
jgi:hypothetical protein